MTSLVSKMQIVISIMKDALQDNFLFTLNVNLVLILVLNLILIVILILVCIRQICTKLSRTQWLSGVLPGTNMYYCRKYVLDEYVLYG